MALTLQNIRDYTRAYLDVDDQDISDVLIDMWVREAQSVVLRARPHWPHLHATYVFNSAVGTTDYALTLQKVRDIQGPQWLLDEISPAEADQLFTPNLANTGDIRYYAKLGANATTGLLTVRLYPTPTAILTFTARGQRAASDPAAGSGVSPDIPEEFHPLVAVYVTAKACMQQNDYEQGQILSGQFGSTLKETVEAVTRADWGDYPVLNVPRSKRLTDRTVRDPRFPFEPLH